MRHGPLSSALHPRPRRQAGFTLIEVMVAILIMAIISVISWRGLDSITRASERLNEGAQASAGLLNALRQFERDVAWRADGEMASSAQADSAISRGTSQDVSLLPPSLLVDRQTRTPWRVEIVRAVAGAPGQWQRVQWWQEGDRLYRNAAPGAAVFPLPMPRNQDRVTVLEGVQRVDMLAWRPGQGWQSLPGAQRGRGKAEGLALTVTLHATQGGLEFRRVMLLN